MFLTNNKETVNTLNLLTNSHSKEISLIAFKLITQYYNPLSTEQINEIIKNYPNTESIAKNQLEFEKLDNVIKSKIVENIIKKFKI